MNATPMTPQARRNTAVPALRRGASSAFTLVELLTVIAIIAILTAIILPVFAAVKENARRTACMSNMQQIYTALRQYELDNRRYPDFLLGPELQANGNQCAVTTIGTSSYGTPFNGSGNICTMQQAAGQGFLGGQYNDPNNSGQFWMFSGGLYPEYIKSLETFHCPNDTPDLGGSDSQTDTSKNTAQRPVVGTSATGGTAGSDNPSGTLPFNFYSYDSYDANPSVANGVLNRGSWQTRYSRLWTRVRQGTTSDPLPKPTDTDYNSYRNQLNWRAPSGDTYITMCTYHAPKGKVTILWLSGSAKVVDVSKLTSYSNSSHTPNLTGDNGNDYDMYKLGPGD